MDHRPEPKPKTPKSCPQAPPPAPTEPQSEGEQVVGGAGVQMKEILTNKQRRFVEEYLIDSNATQAAIRAGYSKRNADKIGSQLLGKTRVKNLLKQKRVELAKVLRVSAEKVVIELWSIGRLTIAEIQAAESIVTIRDKIKSLEILAQILNVADHLKKEGERENLQAEDGLSQLPRLLEFYKLSK